jgi:hypothetical protein
VEAKRKLPSGNACYRSAQNLSSSRPQTTKEIIKICKTIVLPIVLYGRGTLSQTLREEHMLKVFENMMLRRILGLKRDEILAGLRKLLNEKLHYL